MQNNPERHDPRPPLSSVTVERIVRVCSECGREIDIEGCNYGCPFDFDSSQAVQRNGHVLVRTYRITHDLISETKEADATKD
jgi:hypothetical protein